MLGKDYIDICKFELRQLKEQIQYDTCNCGLYCLKVATHCVIVYNMYFYDTLSMDVYIDISFMIDA